jgi:glycolate oxidase
MILGTDHPAIDELRRIVGDASVIDDPNELKVYECDGFPIAKGLPTCVVFPTDTQQVAACMKALGRHADLQIIPRGSGTGLAGGAVGYGGGVLITTTRMNTIEKIDLANRYAVVQAGVRNLALTDALAGSGLHFSPDPSSQRASSIGGNASTNAGGINTLKHGVTTNHVLGLEIVLPGGEVIITRGGGLYDGFGPDLPGLVCGSEGTLGIITRVWCRLVPRPKHLRTIVGVFASTYDACTTVTDTIAAGIIPTSMEMMDSAMIRVVEDAFHLGFDTSAQALLLIEIDGIEQILDDQMQRIVDIARANHVGDIQQCSDPKRRAELWGARKKAFGAIGRISPSYCTQDACIPRSKLPEAMAHIAKLGEQYNLKITNVFHAGDGNIHPIMLFDEEDPEQVQRVLRLSEEILEYCVDIGGTITGEHGVGVEKLHLMGKMFNPATLQTFLDIKKTFDPKQQINDAKLIPSDRLTIELLKPVSANVPGGAL